MENLSRNEVIAIFGLGLAALGVMVAALALQKAVWRFLMIVLTVVISVAFYVYLSRSLQTGKNLQELSKEELVREARLHLLDEQAKREEAFKEARERLARENAERAAAEKAAAEALTRERAEQEAREAVAREDAIKKAREQIEAEKAEQARKATADALIGRWIGIRAEDIEFTRDGKIVRSILPNMGYKVVDANHLELSTWCCTVTYELKWVGDAYDTFEFQWATYKKVK